MVDCVYLRPIPPSACVLRKSFAKVHMYAMVQTHSGTPYAGAKGMLRTIFGLDHLGDDALAIKKALLKVRLRLA